jgi:hypothetical protein
MSGTKHERAAGVKEDIQVQIGNVIDRRGWITPQAGRSTLTVVRRDLPHTGRRAAIIMPTVNTEAMNEYLKEISTQVSPSAYAVWCARCRMASAGQALAHAKRHHAPTAGPYSPKLNPNGKHLGLPAWQQAQPASGTATRPSSPLQGCLALLRRDPERIKSIVHHSWAWSVFKMPGMRSGIRKHNILQVHSAAFVGRFIQLGPQRFPRSAVSCMLLGRSPLARIHLLGFLRQICADYYCIVVEESPKSRTQNRTEKQNLRAFRQTTGRAVLRSQSADPAIPKTIDSASTVSLLPTAYRRSCLIWS